MEAGYALRFRLFLFCSPIVIELKQLMVAQLVVTAALTGLIWIVQLVHYPGFRYVDHTQFSSFQQHHMRSISYIVVPLMLVEVVLSCWLQIDYWNRDEMYIITTANVLLVVIWVATFFVSTPIHSKLLTQGYNEILINKLVDTNWIRTVLWSARTLILIIVGLKV